MWVRRSAIRPVPSWAKVETRVLEKIEEQLASDDDGAKKRLDESFARFETAQPATGFLQRAADAVTYPLTGLRRDPAYLHVAAYPGLTFGRAKWTICSATPRRRTGGCAGARASASTSWSR